MPRYILRKNVCITVPGCTFAELEQATNSELNNLYSWLKANKLSLNIAKTEFMVISNRQKFLAENCSEINIQLDGHPISTIEHAKSLGSNIQLMTDFHGLITSKTYAERYHRQ